MSTWRFTGWYMAEDSGRFIQFRTSLIVVLAFVALIIVVPWQLTAGIPQELNKVTILNRTGRHLVSAFLAPSPVEGASSIWGSDLLVPGLPLRHGSFQSFYIHYPNTCALFDVLFLDANGNSFLLAQVEICNGEEPVVEVGPEHLRAGFQTNLGNILSLKIDNDTDQELWFIFASPQRFAIWGADLLGDSALLGPGETREIRIPDCNGQVPSYDILLVTGNNSVKFRRVQLEDGIFLQVSSFLEDASISR